MTVGWLNRGVVFCLVLAGPAQAASDDWSRARQAIEVERWETEWKAAKALLESAEESHLDPGIQLLTVLLDELGEARGKIGDAASRERLSRIEGSIDSCREQNRKKILARYEARGREALADLEKTLGPDATVAPVQAAADRLAALADGMLAMDETFEESAMRLVEEGMKRIGRSPLQEEILLSSPLDVRAQGELVEKIEGLWQEARRLIDRTDPKQVQVGLEKYGELVEQLDLNRDKVTRIGLQERIAAVDSQMNKKKQIIKLKLLERYVKQGHQTLALMKQSLMAEKSRDVVRIFEKDLEPLCRRMVATDEDFKEVAGDILARGTAIKDEAMADD